MVATLKLLFTNFIFLVRHLVTILVVTLIILCEALILQLL